MAFSTAQIDQALSKSKAFTIEELIDIIIQQTAEDDKKQV